MKWTLVITGLLLNGCVNQDVIVDRKGLDEQQFQKDLVECQTYTQQINTGVEALRHGAIGAVVGGAIGAIAGDSRTAEQFAGVGAVTGSVQGATHAEHRKVHVVNNCLRGRGYRVLG